MGDRCPFRCILTRGSQSAAVISGQITVVKLDGFVYSPTVAKRYISGHDGLGVSAHCPS